MTPKMRRGERGEDTLIEKKKDDGTDNAGANPTPGGSGTQKQIEKPKNNESNPKKKSDSKSFKVLCRFYNNGKCKFNKDCRFDHPIICNKFRANGSAKFNEKG